MEKIYKSKVDIMIVLVCMICVILPLIIILLINDYKWIGLTFVLVPVIILVANVLFGIKYIIRGDSLTVKESVFFQNSYNILSIKKIKGTRSVLSAPAASFDRLDIIFSNGKHLIISPKNKNEFIHELTEINPDIEISALEQ